MAAFSATSQSYGFTEVGGVQQMMIDRADEMATSSVLSRHSRCVVVRTPGLRRQILDALELSTSRASKRSFTSCSLFLWTAARAQRRKMRLRLTRGRGRRRPVE